MWRCWVYSLLSIGLFIITTMVVLSLAAPVLGLLAGFVGLIFPAGRTRLNGGSVVLCSAMLVYLVLRYELYRLVL